MMWRGNECIFFVNFSVMSGINTSKPTKTKQELKVNNVLLWLTDGESKIWIFKKLFSGLHTLKPKKLSKNLGRFYQPWVPLDRGLWRAWWRDMRIANAIASIIMFGITFIRYVMFILLRSRSICCLYFAHVIFLLLFCVYDEFHVRN